MFIGHVHRAMNIVFTMAIVFIDQWQRSGHCV